jgi:UDP-N-acetylmuramoyl-tripeptide--D-alanyl-D-alanine ligase
MTAQLWGWEEIVTAAGGELSPAPGVPSRGMAPLRAITGLSIDSRGLLPGEVFVALQDQRDGHEFVSAAFQRGAAAALVRTGYTRKPADGPLIRVAEPLAGLTGIAAAARARLSPDAGVVAVTGSVGKTSTKEMLRACLARLCATHAPERSFNNHWGVPLTLARMPASTSFGVLEIGMNHAGEITPLTRLARPHVAVITTVEAVHIEHFPSVEAIADAKAEILLGLEPGGIAVLNRDNAHYERLAAAARAVGAGIVSFGEHPSAGVRMIRCALGTDRTEIEAECSNGRILYSIGAPGRHMALNSLAVVAAIEGLGQDFESTIHAVGALAGFGPPAGRGARETIAWPGGSILLVDESYNANPASMRAALAALALVPRAQWGRRIAVLGDMLELGERSVELHAGLDAAIREADIDVVLAAGPNMKALYDRVEPRCRGAWAETAAGLSDALMATIRAGDAVMVKGSYGSRMGPLVEALKVALAKRTR